MESHPRLATSFWGKYKSSVAFLKRENIRAGAAAVVLILRSICPHGMKVHMHPTENLRSYTGSGVTGWMLLNIIATSELAVAKLGSTEDGGTLRSSYTSCGDVGNLVLLCMWLKRSRCR